MLFVSAVPSMVLDMMLLIIMLLFRVCFYTSIILLQYYLGTTLNVMRCDLQHYGFSTSSVCDALVQRTCLLLTVCIDQD